VDQGNPDPTQSLNALEKVSQMTLNRADAVEKNFILPIQLNGGTHRARFRIFRTGSAPGLSIEASVKSEGHAPPSATA
jgi:hypothetical protein